MRPATRRAVVALSTLLALSSAAYAGTGANDNVEGLQGAARKAIEDVQDLQGAVDDALAIVTALISDAKFQSDVINAINVKDQTVLGNLLRQKSTRSTFSLRTLDTSQSFRTEFAFTTRKGKDVLVCISTRRTCGPKGDEFASVTPV